MKFVPPPPKPIGESRAAFFMRWVWDCLAGGKFPIRGGRGVIVEHKDGAYEISTDTQRRSVPGGEETTDGMVLRGDWDDEATYEAQNVVRLTGVGMFVALTDVPAGVSPTTGAPYWFFWLNPPPGVWSL